MLKSVGMERLWMLGYEDDEMKLITARCYSLHRPLWTEVSCVLSFD